MYGYNSKTDSKKESHCDIYNGQDLQKDTQRHLLALRRSNSRSRSSSSVSLEKLSSPNGFHPDISGGLLTV